MMVVQNSGVVGVQFPRGDERKAARELRGVVHFCGDFM